MTESLALDASEAAVQVLRVECDRQLERLADTVCIDGSVSRTCLDDEQHAAFVLARAFAEHAAARAMLANARTSGAAIDAELTHVYVAMALQQALSRDIGCVGEQSLIGQAGFIAAALGPPHLHRVADTLLRLDRSPGVRVDAHAEEVRQLFAKFGDQRLAPIADRIHRADTVVPEEILRELAELGAFGLSIPEQYGGYFTSHLGVCIATEELSRASLGAGGSVITRPEICAKALLAGGTEEQKRLWLPRMATGEVIVAVAVTEPDAGSDVANVRVTARHVDSGYMIDGEKTWCTFAGRADTILLLARTGSIEDGARGLTMLLASKPPTIEGDEYRFAHTQDGGGSIEGTAIPTIGYRGMHSFTVRFADYFVPESHRIGREGDGFALQMQGFVGGRIQTAARALGVMESAYRLALAYARDRTVFGKPLASYSLTRAKLVRMAATIQACRVLTYEVAHALDERSSPIDAALVKLLACRDAEWVTREAMQLHGGMGYSEEFTISRLWLDARVLSLFEGAEEVLAIHVVARQLLRELAQRRGPA